jgi:ankyrin repeat protein
MQRARSAYVYFDNLLALYNSAPDLNTPNLNGMSPLARALIYGNYTSAKALVLAGCKINSYARLQRLKNLSVDGQLGVFDNTKLLKAKFPQENIEWCRHDPI